MHAISLITDNGKGDAVHLGAALVAGKKVPADAIGLLTEDHRQAEKYFAWYEASSDAETKRQVALKLCIALRAHMQIEEESFYPAAREALDDEALLDRSAEEHAEARELVERIESSLDGESPPDELVIELKQAIEQHVEEEEDELFRRLRDADLDSYGLGSKMAARKVDFLFRAIAGPVSDDEPQPREDYMTAISEEEAQSLYVTGLRDIHAAAAQGKDIVEKQLNRVERYPHMHERLQLHLKEKDAQLERVEAMLEDLGEQTSSLKDTAMQFGGKITSMINAGTKDEILKNSLATFGLANFALASYQSLVVMATTLGRIDDARKLQESVNEERSMATWLAENLKGVVLTHLQYRTEGEQASR